MSLQVTRDCKILRVIAIISGSRVLRAAKPRQSDLNFVTVVETMFELTFNWDDELGNDRKHLGSTLLEHVEDTLDGEETVGILLFTDTFEEDGQVMVVIELHNVDFPEDSVLGSVLDGDGKVTTVVEASEFTGNDGAAVNGTSNGLLNDGLSDGFQKGSCLSTKAFSFLKGS